MRSLRRFWRYFEICNWNLVLTDLNKKKTVYRYCNCYEIRPFLKQITEGNARNSRLIYYADVTKIGKKHGWFGSNEQNTRASHHASMRIMHIATENMWFLRKWRKPFLKPYISIITVISRRLKKERERIQFDLTLDGSSAARRRL